MINYSLNNDGIFYVTFSETVTVDDIESFLQELEKQDNLPSTLLSLYDLRNAEMKLDNKDISFVSKMSEAVTEICDKVRTAFLVDKPFLTAYSILFSEKSTSKHTKREVFSTEEAALEWLRNNV